MKKSVIRGCIVLLCVVGISAAYLVCWPTGLHPRKWAQPPSPPLSGVLAPNGLLRNIQRVASGVGTGPEGIAVDARGYVYTGFTDGRVIEIAPDAIHFRVLADNEHSRPLGITFGPNGGFIVADARRGLTTLEYPLPSTLLHTVDGRRVEYAYDVDNTRLDKNVYFTDATRFEYRDAYKDTLEHQAWGRLIEYNVSTRSSRVLINNLQMATGVAVGADDAYVVVAEAGEYQLHRYWLKGDQAGHHELFGERLPGRPARISYDDAHHLFWVALDAPRSAAVDALAAKPAWYKQLLARLPAALQPSPPRKAWVLALDEQGSIQYSLDDESPNAFGPITSARAWGPWLWLGSSEGSLGRIPLNTVMPSAPLPPREWASTVLTPQQLAPRHNLEAEREAEEARERQKPEGTGQEDGEN